MIIAEPVRGEPDLDSLIKAIVEEGVSKHGRDKDVAAAFNDLEVRLQGLRQADSASALWDNSSLITAISLFFESWEPAARGEQKDMSAEDWERWSWGAEGLQPVFHAACQFIYIPWDTGTAVVKKT